LTAPADLARAAEALGATVPAPVEHPFAGAVEVRWIAPGRLPDACRLVRDAGYFFESLSCVDRLDPHGCFELIYTFNTFAAAPSGRLVWRVWAPREAPVPTVSHIFGAASWNEREAWELYGVGFAGHPNLTWLLLPEGTAWRPLLRSFTAPPPSDYDDSRRAAPAAASDDQPARH